MDDSLKRTLGFPGVFSVAAGAMISSGLFVLPGIVFAEAGPAVIIAYALAGLTIVPVMQAQAELCTAMPQAGGSYFFIERSLGPLAGLFAGFAGWLAVSLKAAFALVGIGALAQLAFGLDTQLGLDKEMTIKLVAVPATLFFGVINTVSTKHAGRLQAVLVIGLLGALVLYVIRGVPEVEVARLSPFAPHGILPILSATGMVFVSFGGLTKVAAVAEEVKDPKRNIPLGMFAAFFVVCSLYVLIVFITVGVVPARFLEKTLAPLSLGADQTMGTVGIILIDVGAILAFATTANSGILAASRSPMAMGRDGLLPEFFTNTNKRFGTPHRSIIVTTFFIMVIICFLNIGDLVKMASTVMIITFILVNFSLVIMRFSGIQNYRPSYRAPLAPWLQIIALIIYAFFIVSMGAKPLILTGAFTLIALLWYVFYVHRKIERESAIVYLVRQVISGDIRRTGLEEELKKITIERDQISLDRFDRLVKDAEVVDLDEEVGAKEYFEIISKRLGQRLDIEKDYLYDKFIHREHESSTVVKPGVAIPHVIVEGEGIFFLLLTRAKKGIVFSELNEPVHTAFVLIGSRDERNFHLRALMNIAQVVEDADFEERWRAAPGEEGLKDLILLTKRRRDSGRK